MSETFTTSNGLTVAVITPGDDKAMEEYFQRRRDALLGRWRDTENPDLVCYDSCTVPPCERFDAFIFNEHERINAVRKRFVDIMPTLWS